MKYFKDEEDEDPSKFPFTTKYDKPNRYIFICNSSIIQQESQGAEPKASMKYRTVKKVFNFHDDKSGNFCFDE